MKALELATGADPADLERVASFAIQHNLSVVKEDPANCRIVLEGSPEALERAFHVKLKSFHFRGAVRRAHAGPVCIPEELAGIVEYVSGLDDLPLFHPSAAPAAAKSNAAKPTADLPRAKYSPLELAKLYRFPSSPQAECGSIGIIMPAGGFFEDDLEPYFSSLSLKVPKIKVVGRNQPGDKADVRKALKGEIPITADIAATLETSMDIQLIGALANDAQIIVYLGNGFHVDSIVELFSEIVADDKRPAVISGSWGTAESSLPKTALDLIDKKLMVLAAYRVSVCFASGDNGSTSLPQSPDLITTYPASSAYVLACGGTEVESKGDEITSERVWNSGRNASGGGLSTFPLPAWQSHAGVAEKLGKPGRGVPDVAACASKTTGCKLLVSGTDFVSSGTSAAAPVWASLLWILNGHLGSPIGFFNPILYRPEVAQTLRGITVGCNNVKAQSGPYRASHGWNACCGWGSPRGDALLNALRQVMSKTPINRRLLEPKPST